MERKSTRKLFKILIALAAFMVMCVSAVFAGCSNPDENTLHVHNFGSTPVLTTEATCGNPGSQTFECTDCKARYTITVPATNQHDFSKGEYCSGCGIAKYSVPATPSEIDKLTEDQIQGLLGLAAKVDTLDASVKAMNGTVGSVSGTLQGQDGLTLKSIIDELAKVMAAIPTGGATSEEVTTLSESVTQALTGITNQLTTMTSDNGAFSELKTQLGSLQSAIAAINTDTDDLSSQISKVLEAVKAVQTSIEEEFHTHSYGAAQLDTPATCTEFGVVYRECSECGIRSYYITNTVPHNDSKEEKIEPTCVEPGYIVYRCSMCNIEMRRTVDPDKSNPAGHKWSAAVHTKGHCEEEEQITLECENCDATKPATVPAGHTYSYEDYTGFTQIECGKSAKYTAPCSACGESQEITLNADDENDAAAIAFFTEEGEWKTEHGELVSDNVRVYEDYGFGDPNGKSLYHFTLHCPDCEYTKAGETKWENHMWRVDIEKTKAANTPEQVGEEEVAPTVEFLVEGDNGYIRLGGDDLETEIKKVVKNTSCTKDMIIVFTCIEAAHNAEPLSATLSVKADGHHWANGAADWDGKWIEGKEVLPAGWAWKVGDDQKTLESTCTKEGTAYRICEICSEVETKTVELKAHVLEHTDENYTKPTCLEDGFWTGKCKSCQQEEMKEFNKGSATGHDLYEGEDSTPGDCKTPAHIKWYCRNCDQLIKEEDGKLGGHHWVEDEDVTRHATCGSDGWIVEECDVCRSVTRSYKEDATGDHHWASDAFGRPDYWYEAEETCTSGANYYLVCEDCGAHAFSFHKDALGHEYTEWTVGVASTCVSQGYEERNCSRCGEAYETKPLALAQHTYGDETYEVKASCEADGLEGQKCTVCGFINVLKVLPKHGHWYYTISEKEAAGMTKAQLEEKLNYVKDGETLTSCLTPTLRTVECVYCGVRYEKVSADDKAAPGHTYEIVVDARTQVMCGELINTKTILHCTVCGYYFDITDNEAKYIGESGKILAELGDNEKINDRYLAKEDNEFYHFVIDATADKDEQAEAEKAYNDSVKSAYTGNVQLHKFVLEDEYKLDLVPGDCETEGVYVYVCSICGYDNKTGAKTIIDDDLIGAKKDEDGNWIISRDYYDAWYAQYKAEVGNGDNESVMEKLGGYTKMTEKWETYATELRKYLSKNATDWFDADAEESNTIPGLGLYKMWGFMRYTGYNFTGFTIESAAHDWLVKGAKDCLVDPVLEWIFEDMIGIEGRTSTMFIPTSPDRTYTQGRAESVRDIYSRGVATAQAAGKVYTFGDRAKQFEETFASQWDTKYEGSTWYDEVIVGSGIEDVPVAPYLTLINKMCDGAEKLAAWSKLPNFLGITNWCKADKCPSKTNVGTPTLEDLVYGFKAATPHKLAYNIYVDKKAGDAVYGTTPEESTTFVIGEGDLPEITDANVEQYANDLRFVQWLIDTNTTAKTGKIGEIYKKYETGGILDSSVLSNGEITCMVKQICENGCDYHVDGKHQGTDGNDAYEANCRRGALCVACGEVLGEPADHNLVDIMDEKVQEIFTASKSFEEFLKQTEFKNLKFKPDGFEQKCWMNGDSTFDTLKVCVGCIEAWVAPVEGDDPVAWKDTKASAGKPQDVNYEVGKDTVKEVNHSAFTLDAATAKAVITEFPEKFPEIDLAKADDATMIAAVKDYINGKDGLGLTFKVNAQKDTDVVTGKIDENNKLVLDFKGGKSEGACIGEIYKKNLCILCALHWEKNSVVNVDEKKDKETFGIENAGTNGGKYDAKPVSLHVYAPAASMNGKYILSRDGVYMVNLICLRCGKEVNMPVSQAESGYSKIEDAWKQWVYVTKLSDFDDQKVKDKVSDIEDMKAAFDEKACEITEEFAHVESEKEAQTEFKNVVKNGGVLEISEDLDKVALNTEAKNEQLTVGKVDEPKDIAIVIPDGTTVTLDSSLGEVNVGSSKASISAVYVAKGSSLKISGGTFIATSGDKGATTSIGANGEGSKIEFVNTTVIANHGIQAEDGGDIVFDHTTVISTSPMAVSTNFTKTDPKASFTFTDSLIVSNTKQGNLGLLVNSNTVTVNATRTTFYGIVGGAWIRAAKEAKFEDCTFVTGNAKTNNTEASSYDWANNSGTYRSGDVQAAALLVGDGKGTYGDANVELKNCHYVISYEWYEGKTYNKDTTTEGINTEDGDLVGYDAETNTFKFDPYTAPEQGGAKGSSFIVVTKDAQRVNVTFDTASAAEFGITKDTLKEKENVFYLGTAKESKSIVVEVSGTKVLGE